MKENMKGWNWKSYVAGMATSFVLVGLVGGAIAYSASQVSFNMVNIGTGSSTLATKGNDYRLENGSYVPYSITYTDERGGGTVYLPIRKISEFTQTSVSWDAATNQVIVNVDTTEAYNNAIGKGDSYQDGYNDGYADGSRNSGSSGSYNSGYNDGYDDGYAAGKKVNTSNGDYQTGYNDGYTVGYNAGKGAARSGTTDRYQEGYDAGFSAGKAQGVTEGEKTGYDKGLSDGKESGYQEGYEDGLADGKEGSVTTPDETPEKYDYYPEFPTVPDFGDVTGAASSSPRKNTLENGVAYDYALIDYQDALNQYLLVLKGCNFIRTNASEENYGTTYIYQKGDIYVHVGVKASMMTNGIGIPTYPDSKFSALAEAVQKAKQDVITANIERPIYDVGSGQWIPDQAAIQKANEALLEVQSEYNDYLNKAINTFSVVITKG